MKAVCIWCPLPPARSSLRACLGTCLPAAEVRQGLMKFDLHSNVEFAVYSIVAGYRTWRFNAFCFYKLFYHKMKIRHKNTKSILYCQK